MASRRRWDAASRRRGYSLSAMSKREQYERALSKVAPKARERAPLLSGGPGEPSVDADELYDQATLAAEGFEPEADLGFPGVMPFTRGVQPNMYRGRLWTMRQYAGFGTADESNARYRYLLSQGQTGLSVAFDLPTQMGFDSDHVKATGEVGRVGVAIDSIDDMRRLLAELPLEAISTSMTINATGATLLALYAAVGEERGVPREALRGTIQNDILKEYIARGTYIYPPRPSLRLIRDVFAFAQDEMPRFNTISISGYHMREAGCTAVQEVAFTLADGIAYVQTAVDAGLDVDKFGRQLSFFFNGHNNLVEEIAKFRAARRLWARLMEERFGAKTDKAKSLRFHCQTAGSTLQAQQPMVNVIRVAMQAMAAVMGGAQSLHTNSYDEALALPTEEAVTLALRTQQVLAYESGLGDIVDPAGGSFAIETMTTRIEKNAMKYIEHIDQMGGMVSAIEQGFVQREIQNAAYQYQLDIEERRRIIVGLNEFVGDSAPIPLLRVDPEVERDQAERVKAFRADRDQAPCEAALAALKTAAEGDDNLLPHIVSAVKANATVGEVSDALREVWGEYEEVPTL